MNTTVKILLALTAFAIIIYVVNLKSIEAAITSSSNQDLQSKRKSSQEKSFNPVNSRRINTRLINAEHNDRDRALREFLIAKQIYDGSMPIDISEIKTLKFKELTNLELEILSYIPNLMELDIEGTEVNSLESLRGFTNLKHLNISRTPIDNLNALKEMQLETLIMKDTEVSDFEALSSLKSLRFLDISGNNIQNINSLKNLSKLIHLDISNTQVADLSPVFTNENLKKINYAGTKVIVDNDNIELIMRTR